MKNFTLILFFLLAGIVVMAQDTIANGNFASWTNNPSGGYNDPNDWNCPNPLSSAINVIPCIQDSATVYTGDRYSCKLVTLYASIISSNIPGTITTGIIPTSPTGSITGGALVHSRPLTVTGWFQYAPAGKDTGGLFVTMIKGDSVIGTGSFNFLDTVNTWTAFTCNITYTSGSTPDTSQLTFVSSIGNGIVNSTLLLDDLNYGYTSGITETAINPINVYPNPASKQLNIDNEAMNAGSLDLYAADGQLAKAIKLHQGTNAIDISTLPAGVYVLSGLGANGAAYRSSVVISK